MADNERGSGRQREWKLKKGLDAFGNMFGLNICFVIGCLPVITIGASLAATYATAIRLQEEEEETILSCYIREFKRNFKQATLSFLAVLVIVAVLLAEWILVNTQTGAISLFYTIVFYLELLFLSLTLAFYFPMIARYQTTMKQAAKNSILLSVGYFWSWLKITVAWVAPIAFSIIYPIIFLYTWYLWLLLIFGMIIWGTSHTIRFVFAQNADALKQTEEEAAEEAKKKEAEKQQQEGAKRILAEAESRRAIRKEEDEEDTDSDTDAQENEDGHDADTGYAGTSGSGSGGGGGRRAEKERTTEKSRQNLPVRNKTDQSKSGQSKSGQNKPGQSRSGQNRNNQKKVMNRYYPAANKAKTNNAKKK